MGTIRRKLLFGFGGLIGLLLLGGVLTLVVLTVESWSLHAILRENYDSVLYCRQIDDALEQLHTQSVKVVFAHAHADSAGYAAAAQQFKENADLQLGNSTLPGELERSREILKVGAEYLDAHRQLTDSPSAEDRQQIFTRELLPRYTRIHELTAQVSQMNLTNLALVSSHVRSTLLAVRNTVIFLMLIGISFATLFVLLIARSILRPLVEFMGSVRQIEAGNLDLQVNVRSRDEVGELAEAFNAMTAKLREFRRLDHIRLQRTQKTTQAAIDSLPDAVAVLAPDGRIEIANRTARTFFALEPGTYIQDIRPDWAEQFVDAVVKQRQGYEPQGYKSAVQIFEKGHERFLLPRSVPMFDEADNVIGVTLILVDVTHLRRADELKSGLLSTVSHELRTPLTSVRMAVRLLLDKRLGELNEKQQTLLSAARADSERLYRILEDILAFGRVESGRSPLQIRDTPVAEVVEHAMAAVEIAATDKHIAVELDFPDRSLILRGDTTLIGYALANLLSNAVKYSGPNSAVRIAIAATPEVVSFAVADQGPGIPEEFRARIFDRYFRVPVHTGTEGAGLGLAIAREIVELHHGQIGVQAAPTGGSVFSFTIPRQDAGHV